MLYHSSFDTAMMLEMNRNTQSRVLSSCSVELTKIRMFYCGTVKCAKVNIESKDGTIRKVGIGGVYTYDFKRSLILS